MKGLIAAVGFMLGTACLGVNVDFSNVLPLDESVEKAERGDAHGLYSLAINCLKATRSNHAYWLRVGFWKLLDRAATAGSADACLLTAALAEEKLYSDCELSAHGRVGRPKAVTSALPALDTVVLTNRILESIANDFPQKRRFKKRSGTRGTLRGRRMQASTENGIYVYHPDSRTYKWYNRDGLTNEVIKAYIREQYSKANALGHSAAEAALNHFETNCQLMDAILEAEAEKVKQEADEERARRDAERERQRQQLLQIQEELRKSHEARQTAGTAEAAKSANSDEGAKNTVKNEKVSVAEKLGTCDFLLNKDFKKNAKYYLCLFSASWCGPCRAEMPRIAKIYAETLRDDPDIELIHFSRDQNDERALAWAKQNDVKFPVVKPKGGNPLDLRCNGIPHLFILKSDGTLVEEDHPMRIFSEEKFRELKCGGSTDGVKSQNDKGRTLAIEGVENVTTEGGLFTLTGPYGIRMTADPGCEKGAEYVMKRLVEKYLPAALRYYGDPFKGKKSTRIFTVVVKRNDGSDGRNYTGPSWGSCSDGIDQFTIGLAKGSDKWEMDNTLLASKILTVCREDDGAALHIYANEFVDGAVKGVDPIPALKEDIRQGLEKSDDGAEKKGRLEVLCRLAPMWSVFEELRKEHPTFILEYCNLKNSRYADGRLSERVSFAQMIGLLAEVTGEDVLGLCKKYGVKGTGLQQSEKISVAEKLGTCDFLLNKDFKKNAKYYLCLFSASWCGPCRAEMPRIAKIYAETLRDDPDIELIHFSRDQNDERALAWAKQNDVKFPVVKPKGGNPLDLRCNGIPHMFILKSDGTLVEEDHPMRIFSEEKFKALKRGI